MKKVLFFSLLLMSCDPIESAPSALEDCWMKCIGDKQAGTKPANADCDEECPISPNENNGGSDGD